MKSLNRNHLLTTATIAFMFGAIATDKASALTPAYNWTGFYVGGWWGGGFGNNSWSNPDDGFLGSVNSSGLLLGGYAGYNWQFGNYVVGVEAGGAWTNIQGGFDKFGWRFAGKLQGLEELTARFGVTTPGNPNLLWFGKIGGALGQYRLTSDWPEIGTSFDKNKTLGGWTVGAGFEYGLSPNWSVRVEYGYYNFSGGQADLTPSKANVDPYRVDIGRTSVNTFTVGADFRFGR